MGLGIHGLVIVGDVAQVSPSAILLNHLAHAADRLHAKQAVNEHQAVKGNDLVTRGWDWLQSGPAAF